MQWLQSPEVRSKLRGGGWVWRRWKAVDAVALEVRSKLRGGQQAPEVVEGSSCRDVGMSKLWRRWEALDAAALEVRGKVWRRGKQGLKAR